MELLIDSGNSRLKWAYSDNGQLSSHGSAARGSDIPAAAQQAWQQGPTPDSIVVANVAGSDYAHQLDQWVQRHWQQAVEYIQVSAKAGGIALAYVTPERFGVDRWLALIAAHRLTPGRVAVIDAGTAVTLDVISAAGEHEGGIIFPGLELMGRALQTAGGIQAGLQTVAATSAERPLGNDTRSCIEKGTLYAVTGGIEHALQRAASAAITVIICGGNAEQLMAELNVECRHIPDLVLQGMQIIKQSGVKQ